MTATGPSNTSAVRLSLNFEPIKAGTGLCCHAEAGIGFYGLLFYAMARIRRNTCSAVSAKFAPAFSVFIASSRVTTPLSIGKNASIPVSYTHLDVYKRQLIDNLSLQKMLQ